MRVWKRTPPCFTLTPLHFARVILKKKGCLPAIVGPCYPPVHMSFLLPPSTPGLHDEKLHMIAPNELDEKHYEKRKRSSRLLGKCYNVHILPFPCSRLMFQRVVNSKLRVPLQSSNGNSAPASSHVLEFWVVCQIVSCVVSAASTWTAEAHAETQNIQAM